MRNLLVTINLLEINVERDHMKVDQKLLNKNVHYFVIQHLDNKINLIKIVVHN